MIHVRERDEEFEIIGDKEGLEALGSSLLLKAKMGDNYSCTITGGMKPIKLVFIQEA